MKGVHMSDHAIEGLKDLQRTLLEDDEIFSLGAQMVFKMYQALITAGFTEEQAIKIVAVQGSGVKTG
jgi:hypothetical protein